MPRSPTLPDQVPNVILTGEAQLREEEAAAAAGGASGGAGQGPGRAAQASFRAPGAGSLGMVSFQGPPRAGPPALLLDDETLRLVGQGAAPTGLALHVI